MRRLALAVVALALLAAAGAAVWVWLSLDWIAKRAIEKYGTEILQAEVTVDSVKLSPATGRGEITGLKVGNPKGFRAPHAATVGRIEIEFDAAALAAAVPTLRHVTVRSPSITCEPGPNGGNFSVLKRNLARNAERKIGTDKEGPRLVVERLSIRDGRVAYAPQVASGKAVIGFDLPAVELTGIGRKSGGATPGQLATVILDAVAGRMAGALGTNALERAVEGLIERAAKISC